MEIVKELNLNKNPQHTKNGSIVYASNIKVSPDNTYLTNDDSIKEIFDIDYIIESVVGPKGYDYFVDEGVSYEVLYNNETGEFYYVKNGQTIILTDEQVRSISQYYDLDIVGVIPTATDLIIFLHDSGVNSSFIVKATKIENDSRFEYKFISSGWKYNGGEIKGTYTYNVNNELILMVAEYGSEKSVPLISINIDTASTNDTINNYVIDPEVPICNCRLIDTIPGKAIPSGTYNFFVRYEISKDQYSKWFPIGIPYQALCVEDITMLHHAGTNPSGDDAIYTNIQQHLNNIKKDCTYNFKLNLVFSDLFNYKGFQLGYILQHENATLARTWHTFKFTDNRDYTIVFDGINPQDGSADELIDSVLDINNVHAIDNYENRCYIGNFEESNLDNDVIKEYTYSDENKILLDFAKDIRVSYKIKDANSVSSQTSTIVTKDILKLGFYGVSKQCNIPLDAFTDEGTKTIQGISGNLKVINFADAATYGFMDLYASIFSENYTYRYWFVPNLTKYSVEYIKANYCNTDDQLRLSDIHYDLIGWYIGLFSFEENGTQYNCICFCRKNQSSAVGYDVWHGDAEDQWSFNAWSHKLDSRIIVDIRIPDHEQHNKFRYSFTTEINSITDIVEKESYKSEPIVHRTLDQNEVYNFFVHYIKPNGQILPGIRLDNYHTGDDSHNINDFDINNNPTLDSFKGLPFCNIVPRVVDIPNGYDDIEILYNDLPLYINRNGDKLFKTPIVRNKYAIISPKFSNIKVPNGFVGVTFSYEKVNGIKQYEGRLDRKIVDNNNTYYLLKSTEAEIAQVNYRGDYFIHVRNTNNLSTSMSDITQSTIQKIRKFDDIQIRVSNNFSKPYNTLGLSGGIFVKLESGIDDTDITDITNTVAGTKPVIAVMSTNLDIYTDEIKTLICLGNPKYMNNYSLQSYSDEDVDMNLPSFFTLDKYPIISQRVAIISNGGVYAFSSTLHSTVDDGHILVKPDGQGTPINYCDNTKFYKYSKFNLNAVNVTDVLRDVSVPGGEEHQYISKYIDLPNYSMLYELKTDFIITQHKPYTNYLEKRAYIDTKDTIIRRSHIMRTESYINSWKLFDTNDYKIINKNKGKITNIVGLGDSLFVHCEHNLLVMTKHQSLFSTTERIKIDTLDVFDNDFKEVFTSEHGYGGLQDYTSYCVNTHGYWFWDGDDKKILRLDEGKLVDLTESINNYILDFYKIKNIAFGTDYKNNRVLMCITGIDDENDEYYKTLSYNYNTNTFISLHSYGFSNAYTTKNNIFLRDKGLAISAEANNIYTFCEANDSDKDHCSYKELYISEIYRENVCFVDVMFNEHIDMIKVLESILYKLTLTSAYSGYTEHGQILFGDYKIESKNSFSGDKLMVYTDSVCTGLLDISNTSQDYNKIDNYKKPHYNKGMWQFNYFRDNIINYVQDGEPENQDNYSLVYGRYFILRFVFHMNEIDKTLRLDNIEINVNRY